MPEVLVYPIDQFLSELDTQLRTAIKANPKSYAYGTEQVPSVIERYRKDLSPEGNGILMHGTAITATCKALGFKPTDAALRRFLRGGQ